MGVGFSVFFSFFQEIFEVDLGYFEITLKVSIVSNREDYGAVVFAEFFVRSGLSGSFKSGVEQGFFCLRVGESFWHFRRRWRGSGFRRF